MNALLQRNRPRSASRSGRMLRVDPATVDRILARAGVTPRPAPAAVPCEIGFDPGMTRTAEVVCWTAGTNYVRPPVRTWLLDDYRAAPIVMATHDASRAIGRCLRVHHCSLGLHSLVEFAPTDAGWATWQVAERIGWSTVYTVSGRGVGRLHEISATWLPANEASRTLRVSRAYDHAERMWPHNVWRWATGMGAEDWQRASNDATQRDLVRLAVSTTYRVLARDPRVTLPGSSLRRMPHRTRSRKVLTASGAAR